MFIITRKNKKYGSKTFSSYEEARSYVRKTIRKYLQMLNMRYPLEDLGGVFYHNPSHTLYGYSIKGN